jgi:hypothetical protein
VFKNTTLIYNKFIAVLNCTLSFAQAVECLKGFEKKDSKVQSTAATDLSFLYFLVSITLNRTIFKICLLYSCIICLLSLSIHIYIYTCYI